MQQEVELERGERYLASLDLHGAARRVDDEITDLDRGGGAPAPSVRAPRRSTASTRATSSAGEKGLTT